MKTYIKPQTQTIKLNMASVITASVELHDDESTNSVWTRRRTWLDNEEE